MNEYRIWDGGYTATGGHAGPSYHATVTAETFEDACKAYFTDHPTHKTYYDPERNTLWGMRLYDGPEPGWA